MPADLALYALLLIFVPGMVIITALSLAVARRVQVQRAYEAQTFSYRWTYVHVDPATRSVPPLPRDDDEPLPDPLAKFRTRIVSDVVVMHIEPDPPPPEQETFEVKPSRRSIERIIEHLRSKAG